jgi:dienelactone hydrolase
LFTRLEPAEAATDKARYIDLLETWMLDDERKRGVMVLSFLDKPPFFSASRYAAANVFAGFHAEDGGALAHVTLYANRGGAVMAELTGDERWTLQAEGGPRCRRATIELAPHDLVKLHLRGPADLAGRESIAVNLRLPDGSTQPLRIAEDATVEPRWPYQVRQAPRYMERRFREKLGPPPEATADEIRAWQRKMRAKCQAFLALNADEPCDLAPRLVERQVGPTCVREKWLVQSEPGIWVPGYLIRPKSMTGRRPLLYQLHGSGPGKDGFAFDETEKPQQTQFGHELEGMPYRVAVGLNCQVYVPDGRGQGEMGETNPAQWLTRMETLGLSNMILRVLDQMRALDWLLLRSDVDAQRIGSFGCSGGGGLTYYWAAFDERVAASLVSSTSAASPIDPLPDGFFHREFAPRLGPLGPDPLRSAPLGMLIAPRPMWIIDGKEDLGIEASQRAAWRERMQKGRDQIRAVYRRLGAEDRYEDTWFPAGHCAGVTVANVVAYFRKWFGA